MFAEVLKRDPEILLRSSVSRALPENREKLVAALLKMSVEDALNPYDVSIRSDLSGLNHATLANQVRPYLIDINTKENVRHFAITLARTCRLVELFSDLATIALDNGQPLALRINAASTVAIIGDDLAKSRLKPLATEDQPDDADDELKGCAFSALWPHFIGTDELFSNLSDRKSGLYGTYFRFVVSQLPQQIRQSDLPIALRRLEQRGARGLPEPTFAELDAAIMSLCLQAIAQPSARRS